MNEPKFTPGPWHVLYDELLDEYRCIIHNEKNFLIAIVSLAVIRRGETYKEKQLANAHLIAAAPEMYQMLEMVLRDWELPDVDAQAKYAPKIERLLAKARGERSGK